MTGDHPKRNEPSSMSLMGMYSSIGGRVLSHYEVGAEIGKGGMGQVYEGRDVRLDRRVAIKVLPQRSRGDPQAREQFRKEARAASALNHPNIVTVYDVDEDKGVDLMVMEYVAGKTLGELIPARGLSVPKALAFALQIADALHAAHSAGILHGDLKPANVMVTGDDRVKLLDFGLAKALAAGRGKAGKTRKSDQHGTRVYMSPEQLNGRAGDLRSEVFSFGLVLYQILSGRHPFGPGTRDNVTDAIRRSPPADFRPKVPRVVADLVRRCLEKPPARRFQSMQDVLLALNQCRQANPLPEIWGVPHAAPEVDGGAKLRQIRAIAKRITYENGARSQQALAELERLIESGGSPAVREAVTAALRDVILTVDQDGHGVSGSARELRRLTLGVLRVSTQGGFASCFKVGELERLDLYGMNFAGEQLAGLSFKLCFLVETSFAGCDLSLASFAGAWIRNVNFADASLSDADLTDADWFNAVGLTEGQLASVRRDTLLDCPSTVQGLRHVLDARYGHAFDSWTTQVQEQLKAAWKEYLRPGGLRDIVARWRKS